jgi:hypothetical protein
MACLRSASADAVGLSLVKSTETSGGVGPEISCRVRTRPRGAWLDGLPVMPNGETVPLRGFRLLLAGFDFGLRARVSCGSNTSRAVALRDGRANSNSNFRLDLDSRAGNVLSNGIIGIA